MRLTVNLSLKRKCSVKLFHSTPLYKPYRYVPLQKVWVLGLFGLKTDIDFANFGLESGMVFDGTTGVYERIYRFNSKK